MGGVPPLVYKAENRPLLLNETEAAVVRRIFGKMLTAGSPTQIGRTLTGEGRRGYYHQGVDDEGRPDPTRRADRREVPAQSHLFGRVVAQAKLVSRRAAGDHRPRIVGLRPRGVG